MLSIFFLSPLIEFRPKTSGDSISLFGEGLMLLSPSTIPGFKDPLNVLKKFDFSFLIDYIFISMSYLASSILSSFNFCIYFFSLESSSSFSAIFSLSDWSTFLYIALISAICSNLVSATSSIISSSFYWYSFWISTVCVSIDPQTS